MDRFYFVWRVALLQPIIAQKTFTGGLQAGGSVWIKHGETNRQKTNKQTKKKQQQKKQANPQNIHIPVYYDPDDCYGDVMVLGS